MYVHVYDVRWGKLSVVHSLQFMKLCYRGKRE